MGVFDSYAAAWGVSGDYYATGRPLDLSPGSEIRIRVPQVKTVKAPKYYRIENKVFTVSNADTTALTQFAVLSTANEAKEFVKRNNI